MQQRRFHSYLASAVTVLNLYDGRIPLASFLKQFFAANKKFGSSDRKQISDLCYSCFRLGKAGQQLSIEERIIAGKFCCSNDSSDFLQYVKPEWNAFSKESVIEKLKRLDLSVNDIFPFLQHLSDGLDANHFSLSFLQQPDLYLRIRPGKGKKIKGQLAEAGIAFRELRADCLAFPNTTKISEVIQLDKDAVIQDYSSQRVGELLELLPQHKSMQVWDCCAASGGKSILAVDKLPDIHLTVSDLRASILFNLKKRFQKAGIQEFTSREIDLTKESIDRKNFFDLIIADLPCSGSGTWSRTPEQLYYFKPEEIENYALLQQRILNHCIPALKPGGYLLYITCSVFKKENEDQVQYLTQKFQLKKVEMKLLDGYLQRADSLFGTLLQMNE